MSHPLDLLAPYVDGSLRPSERAAVDAHLRSCPRCERDVSMTTMARNAVRSLPAAESPDLAAGFTPERLAALGGTRPASRSTWSRLVPALAAAAVIAVVALVIPRLGGGADDAGTAAGGVAGSAPDTGGSLRLELDDTDYDVPSIQALAAGSAGALASGGAAGAIEEATSEPQASASEGADQARFAGPGRTARAIACLQRAFPGFPGELTAVRRATFEGTPAFLGFVVEGPGAGTSADTLSIWVAAVEDCSILTVTSASI